MSKKYKVILKEDNNVTACIWTDGCPLDETGGNISCNDCPALASGEEVSKDEAIEFWNGQEGFEVEA